jgi:uncharacterized protein
MEMNGQRQLAVTQQQAWDALNDPEVLKQCVPGCDKMELMDDGRYNVGMAVKIGPVSAKFSGKIAMADAKPPTGYTLNFEGTGGVAGFGKGTSNVSLIPNAEGTLLEYTVNAQVGGKIAQLGQRLIDGASKSMADDFFARFEQVLAERYPRAQVDVVEGETVGAVSTSAEKLNSSASRPPPKTGGLKLSWVVIGVLLGAAFYYFKLR